MNHQEENDATNGANRVPPLLTLNDPLRVRDHVEVFKDPRRRLKRNPMLPSVDAILILIPDEGHVYIRNCSTFAVGTAAWSTGGVVQVKL